MEVSRQLLCTRQAPSREQSRWTTQPERSRSETLNLAARTRSRFAQLTIATQSSMRLLFSTLLVQRLIWTRARCQMEPRVRVTINNLARREEPDRTLSR